MALQNTDNFLVNRGGSSYKAPFSDVRAPADAAQNTANTATISPGAFDLSQGNMWTCGAITVPNPANATVGQSGLIRITAGPVVWGANFKFPGAAAPTLTAFPAIIPYYVQGASTILMGNATEGIV